MKLDTPQTARQIGTMPDPDEWAEADMTADEATGKPLARSPEQGIKDMQARITVLQQRKRAALDNALNRQDFIDTLKLLDADLTEARQRLLEYQAQLKGKN